jgi:hypothetical protein
MDISSERGIGLKRQQKKSLKLLTTGVLLTSSWQISFCVSGVSDFFWVVGYYVLKILSTFWGDFAEYAIKPQNTGILRV